MPGAADLIDAVVADGCLPGAVLLAGRAGRTELTHVAGRMRTGGEPISPDTVFDLASLTKVMATLPCVLLLADQGKLDLDDPVVRYLPAFGGDVRSTVTIRQLLSHTSGLPAGHEFYEMDTDAAHRWLAVPQVPLVSAPGTEMVYSDIGFLLLGLIVEAITSVRLDEAAHALVFRPLGLADTRF